MTTVDSAAPQWRTRSVWLLYCAMGILGFAVNGIGSVLAPLQTELGVSRSAVAFYPSVFALALVLVGLVGGKVAESLGVPRLITMALAGAAAGASLLASGVQSLVVAGIGLLGIGCAFIMQSINAHFSQELGARATAAIGEANAVSSWASVIAPWAVAGALAVSWSWIWGYSVPLFMAAALLTVLYGYTNVSPRRAKTIPANKPAKNAAEQEATIAVRPTPGLEPGRLFPRWIDTWVAICTEFCFVFWAASALQEWHGTSQALAAGLISAFLFGMALCRSVISVIVTGRHPLTVLLGAACTALTGFFLFWLGPNAAWAAAGLFLAGLGIAPMYPVLTSRLLAAWPGRTNQASARGSLASGLAVGLAPIMLAALADLVGMSWAYLIVPVLLSYLIGRALWGLRPKL